MALREIVVDGDPILRKTSRPVEKFDEKLATLLDDMAETMYFENRGIGIAAVQVGILRRAFVVDVGDEHGKLEFVNPEIYEREGAALADRHGDEKAGRQGVEVEAFASGDLDLGVDGGGE